MADWKHGFEEQRQRLPSSHRRVRALSTRRTRRFEPRTRKLTQTRAPSAIPRSRRVPADIAQPALRLRPGATVTALEHDLRDAAASWARMRPSVWHRTADEILDTLAQHRQRISGSRHESGQRDGGEPPAVCPGAGLDVVGPDGPADRADPFGSGWAWAIRSGVQKFGLDGVLCAAGGEVVSAGAPPIGTRPGPTLTFDVDGALFLATATPTTVTIATTMVAASSTLRGRFISPPVDLSTNATRWTFHDAVRFALPRREFGSPLCGGSRTRCLKRYR
ncbi:MAG: hypothetical protein QOH28_187 [Actinomycetota bacterium]|nr:hypothetical protein [Actinomycetota bacterium]